MTINIKQLSTESESFWKDLEALISWESVSDDKVFGVVTDIISQIRQHGDAALIEYTNKFDRMNIKDSSELEISADRLKQSFDNLNEQSRELLKKSADRIFAYHKHQKQDSWSYTEADGTMLGQQVTPVDRAGLYVPGGKAAYPSSVLMNAIPAKVAGVKELIMVVPTPDGEINDLVFAAAHVAKVDRVFCVGGAQAVAALAYGTETIPPVVKIVGPGNIYVATAKRMVYGTVGIDMIAGPSEILVVCDGKTDPDWIAMD